MWFQLLRFSAIFGGAGLIVFALFYGMATIGDPTNPYGQIVLIAAAGVLTVLWFLQWRLREKERRSKAERDQSRRIRSRRSARSSSRRARRAAAKPADAPSQAARQGED